MTGTVRLQVGDTAAARIAATAAAAVPGVVMLRADLAQTLLGVAGSVFGHDRTVGIPTDGVTATVDGTVAEVTVTIVTRIGDNCRDVAVAVQRGVMAELAEQAGLAARVRVTVADVLLG